MAPPGPVPAFPPEEYRARLDRTLAAMAARRVDTLVVFGGDSVHYLTGLDVYGFLSHQALLVSARLAGPLLVQRALEAPGVALTAPGTEAVFYQVPAEDPVDRVLDVLKGRGLARGTVGLERAGLPGPVEARYARGLEGVPVADASDLVGELRLVKSTREQACVREAARLADLGLAAAVRAAIPGATELEVAAEAQAAMSRAGSEYPAIPLLLASGPRTAMIHGMPGRRRLEPGDLVTVEHAGVVARYHAIVMRTLCLGEPGPRVRQVARVQAEALAAAQDAVRPDGPVRAPDDACRAVLRAAGLEDALLHRLGFSLGVAYPPTWIEGLSLWAADPHRFAPGMVFSLEPNLCLAAEGFALKLGDTVLMRPDGPEPLSAVPRDLLVR